MPKIYVRVNPRSQISKRHRCATEFTNVWKEIDVDDATRAALEEDAYLEVSDTPTVLVEVAAATQAGAIDPYPDPFNPVINDQNPNNPEKSEADEGQGDAAQGSDVTGTASPAADAIEEGAAATDGEQRRKDIGLAIGMLDQANPEHWLKDGRPNVTAVSAVSGLTVTAEERDAVWASLNKGAE